MVTLELAENKNGTLVRIIKLQSGNLAVQGAPNGHSGMVVKGQIRAKDDAYERTQYVLTSRSIESIDLWYAEASVIKAAPM